MKDRTNVTYEYKKLNTKDLCLDGMYQRDLDKARVDRIVKRFDPCLANAVKVSFREGKYYIFDGQHTTAAEKQVFGNGQDVTLECKVYYGLTRLDEMELFVAQNGESSAVNVNAKLKALYNFGDKDVIGMVKGAECAGVRVDFGKSQAMNKVTALSTLLKTYLKLPRDQYIDMLATIKAAWGGVPDSFCREILLGMARFYETYYGEFKSRELAKNLSKIPPVQIPREGKAMGAATLTASVYARIILRFYNSGRSKNRLEDKL